MVDGLAEVWGEEKLGGSDGGGGYVTVFPSLISGDFCYLLHFYLIKGSTQAMRAIK